MGKRAIIKNENSGEYRAVDPIYNKTEDQTEYISANIIEDEINSIFFERVYPVNLITKTVYKLKEEAKELIAKNHTQ